MFGFVGMLIAMVLGIAVNDPEPAQQRVSLALAVLAAATSVTLGTLSADVEWLQLALFCAVVFFATIVRRLGPRGLAVGFPAFLAYFFTLFVKGRAEELPWMLGAIAIGAASAYVIRFWVVRFAPDRVLANGVRAVRARVDLLLADVAAVLGDADASDRRWRSLLRASGQLNDLTVALAPAAGIPKPGEEPSTSGGWAAALLEAELAVETLLHAFRELSTGGATAVVRGHLGATATALRAYIDTGSDAARGAALDALALASAAAPDDTKMPNADRTARARAWREATYAVHVLTRGRSWTTPPGSWSTLTPPVSAGIAAGAPSDWSTALRLAVQATLAAAAAIAAGRLLSPTRWYWAVIAAFVVFVRGTTVGESLARAWQRVLGTVAGVGVGLAIAHAVGHHVPVAIAIAFVALFVAYYFLQVAYGTMITCFTIALALLYDALGRPVSGLLLLRLTETLAGAAVGAAVALLVLPHQSGEKLRALTAVLVRAAEAPVSRATGDAVFEPNTVLADVRTVDRALAPIRATVRPLWQPSSPIERPGPIRTAYLAAAVAYAVRRLGHAASQRRAPTDGTTTQDCSTPLDADLLAAVGGRLARACREVAEGLQHGHAVALTPATEDVARLRGACDVGSPDAPGSRVVDALDDLDAALRALATSVA